jgi:peptidoglycan/xylan/chitin deacetylase (PgdA/CDA1 family)
MEVIFWVSLILFIYTVARLSEFESHMAFLAKNDWNVISMHYFLEKQKQDKVEKRDIVLTFDDGHISHHRFGFTATFFIIADRIGTSYHMEIEELSELAAGGMEIASHEESDKKSGRFGTV